jgi:hypothetical protein
VLGGLIAGFYNLKKDSADGRILIWRVSAEMIKDKPLFGHGLNGFQAKYMDYQAEYLKEHPNSAFSKLADNNRFAFNEFVRIMVEQGLIGLLVNILLLYLIIFNVKSSDISWEASIIKSSFISLLAFGCFSYPMAVYQFKLIIVLFIALLSSFSTKLNHFKFHYFRFQSRFQSTSFRIMAVIIFFVGIFYLIRFTSVIRHYDTACKKWNAALLMFNNTDTLKSIELLKSTYPLLKIMVCF